MIEGSLPLSTSLLLSINGLVVVFTVLVTLALATILIARVIGIFKKPTPAAAESVPAPAATQPTAGASAPAEEDISDIIAVLQGALSLESGIPVDQLEVVSVRCVTNSEQH